jgi:hypothetical protein
MSPRHRLAFSCVTGVLAGQLLLRACGCKGASAPTPEDPLGLATVTGQACATLRRLGCPEGAAGHAGETCYQRLSREALVTDVPAACVADAGSPAAVRGCGDPTLTITFRCRVDGDP